MAKKIRDIDKALPVIPLRGTVVFPGTVTPILVGRDRSTEALEFASKENRKIFLVAQKDPKNDEPEPEDLFRIGTIARVVQVMRFPSGMLKALVEGEGRARVARYQNVRTFIEAVVERFEPIGRADNPEIEALVRKVRELFAEYVKLTPNLPDELGKLLDQSKDPNQVADVISAQLTIDFTKKQDLLQLRSLKLQLNQLIEILAVEINVLRYKEDIEHKVQKMIDEGQREYFLRQQMEAIRTELGEDGGSFEEDYKELDKKIKAAWLPDKVRETLEKEYHRLMRTPSTSPESAVTRTYIEWLLDLPWFATSKDSTEIKNAESILDEDHYGLEKLKLRILEHIAVMSLSSSQKGPILCFVGPPGVGKTSVAKSIARALGREFVRASLGGLHDEAEIRGHRKTYVGAMPGKLIQGLKRAEKKNPVFLLDEIDKIGHDFRGDPSAALMEVLDPDQNNAFIDNYIELPFDLSEVLFITTANTIEGIPQPLLDRMELLRIPGYLESEKFHIAKDYLIKKQLSAIPKLEPFGVTFTDDAIYRIIREYTREAGVRELERQIATVVRKVALDISRNPRKKKYEITAEKTQDYLGVPKYVDSPITAKLMPGESIGLAWTAAGGEILRVESLLIPGKGGAKFTGSLGDVMKESVEAALSLIRSRADKIGFSTADLEKSDVHIHFPEGAVPKDGPSAGIAIFVALASLLSKRAVSPEFAMTGEITLSGRVLPIGGLPEKLLAAKRYNITKVIIPEANRKDLEDIKKDILTGLKIITVSTVDDVIETLWHHHSVKQDHPASTTAPAPLFG
jgi:ATP-dependent Lon protease